MTEREVRLTSRDKVLWPRAGFTKGQMLEYYRRVAPVLLPHLSGRPLTLGRFPDGVDGPGFAQTECRGRPDWLPTMPLELRSGEVRNYCLVEDLPSLLWVANLGAIELHVFPGRPGRPEQPAFVVFDLDPGPAAGLLDAAEAALALRNAIADLGLSAAAKTSGSRGVHVLLPVTEGQTFDQTRAFAGSMAERLAGGGRSEVRIDWRQNHPRRSIVAPYSLRSTDRPYVSAPVRWEELEAAVEAGDPSRLRFSPAAVVERVERSGDPLAGALAGEQRLVTTPSSGS